MKHYTINDGLAGNHVYMCHQDPKGYLWVATTSGLSRFDGKKFKNYDFESGLIDNEVLYVLSDEWNNKWFCTFSLFPSIALMHNDSIQTFRNSSLLASFPPNMNVDGGVYSHKYQTLYLHGINYLVFIKQRQKPILKLLWYITNYPVETENGDILVGDTKKVYRVEDTSLIAIPGIHDHEPFKTLYYDQGILYLAGEYSVSLYEYHGSSCRFLKTVFFRDNINVLHCNRHGIWLTFTNQKGAWLYQDHYLVDKPYRINVPGLINHFTQDNEGGVWISTIDNGLFFLPEPHLINYNDANGLASSVVSAIEPLSTGKCWLGYNTGAAQLVNLKKGSASVEKTITPFKTSYGNSLIDIVSKKNGETYFLSREGLAQLKDGQIENLIIRHGGKSLMNINDTLLGIGFGSRYVLLNTKTKVEHLFVFGRIYAHALDSGRCLWAGGINGLYKLPFLNGNNHPDSLRITALNNIKINALALSGDYLWVGTQNQGLYLLKQDSIIAWFTNNNIPEMPSDNIKALAIKGNKIWIGTNWGLLSGDFDYTTKQFKNMVKIDHHDGLMSPDVNEIKIQDSNVFIATYGGLTVLNKVHPKKLVYSFADVCLTNLQDGKIYKELQAVINYSSKGFEIGFNAISFRYNSEIVYRYKLEPFDKEWKITQNSQVQYTNIPPGKYLFRVIACDHRGNKSLQPYFMTVVIQPLYWQTWWFTLLMGLVVLFLIVAAFYFFYRFQNKRTHERLEQGRLIAKSKLHALRAQLKPHFIYNSLNAIKDFIYSNKNEDAADLLQGFACLIRNGFHLADRDFIKIKEEVEFITRYLVLEQKKCDDCFDYRVMVKDGLEDVLIPSLIAQPFVENAVIHGVRNKKNERGAIEIVYAVQGDDIICTITDNGIGILQSVALKKLYQEHSKGMIISKERMEYFKIASDTDIRFAIMDKSEAGLADSGTIVIITIINGKQNISHES